MKLKTIASNMTELTLNDGMIILFSYKTPVAAHKGTGFSLNNDTRPVIKTTKKWSVTTSKHIGKWIKHHNFSKDNVLEVDQSVLDALVNTNEVQS